MYNTYKQADYQSDYLRSIPGNMIANKIIPGVSGLAGWVGSIDGLASKTKTKDIKEYEDSPGLAYIPGVNDYRRAKRLVAIENAISKDKDSKKHSISEILGPATSTILASTVGGIIGDQYEFKNDYNKRTRAIEGALIGALVGAGGHAIGSGIGAISKKREKEEQEKHYDKSTILNYIIPGLAGYNRNKALQLSDEIDKYTKKNKKKINKKEAALTKSIIKQASSTDDNILSIVGATLATPVYYTVYKPLDAIGDLAALAKGTQDDKTIKEMNDPKLRVRALFPGVASYRNTSRNMNLEKKFHNNINQTRSEALGQWSTILGSTAIGTKFGKPGIGALSGIGANIIGAIAGRIATPRTPEKQKEYYDNKLLRIGNYIVPGMASYNRSRTLNISDFLNS